MKYLCIENPGVCPVQGFSILGVSTSRGTTDKIGQFGSGCKHAVNLLLRKRLTPIVFCGLQKLEFSVREEMMGIKPYDRVLMNGEPLGFSTEFGELDWDDIGMAVREFVSNAFDSGSCKLTLTETIEGSEGKTKVFIPYTDEVKDYLKGIEWKFLQFQDKHESQTLEPYDKTCVRLYRRGVYVTSIPLLDLKDEKEYAVFDYNLEFKIDETRNYDSIRARNDIQKFIWYDRKTAKAVLEHLNNFKTCWELKNIDMQHGWDRKVQEIVKSVWDELYLGYCYEAEVEIYNRLVKKGIPVKLVATRMCTFLMLCGIKRGSDLLSQSDKLGATEVEVPGELLRNVNKVWKTLVKHRCIADTKMPAVKCFNGIMNGDGQRQGFYDAENESIHIEEESIGSISVILEELGHHITKADDCTRDFQTWAFKVASLMIKENWTFQD